MKIATYILVCFSILICHFSDAQVANKTIKVRHYELKMDMPGGFGPVLMSDQTTHYQVQLPVGSFRSDEKLASPNVKNLGLQVWLLRADGTVVPQSSKPSLIMMSSFANYGTDYMIYTFDRDPTNDLAGIVIRVKGKLFCREIGPDTKIVK